MGKKQKSKSLSSSRSSFWDEQRVPVNGQAMRGIKPGQEKHGSFEAFCGKKGIPVNAESRKRYFESQTEEVVEKKNEIIRCEKCEVLMPVKLYENHNCIHKDEIKARIHKPKPHPIVQKIIEKRKPEKQKTTTKNRKGYKPKPLNQHGIFANEDQFQKIQGQLKDSED